jgi:PAS domain S-box-containing protein
LGYEVAELLAIPMREVIAPEYCEQFDAYLARMKTVGADKGLMTVLTRTGERRIWEYNNTLRTEGVPLPIVRGMARDVTERVRAEKALFATEERFRQLAESIREVFYLTEVPGHRLLYVSPAYEQVWGNTCQSLYESPESFLDAVHPEDRDAARHTFVSHQPFLHEYRIIRPDGSVRWISDRGFPVRDAKGEVYRLAGIAEDITESKQAEQALQESQAALARVARIATMGELTASIAHEINQPLAAVATNASASLHWLAVQPPNLDEAREAMANAMKEANRAGGVIARIRALLKKASPELRPVDMNEVIREVLALVRRELIRGGVTAKTEAGPRSARCARRPGSVAAGNTELDHECHRRHEYNHRPAEDAAHQVSQGRRGCPDSSSRFWKRARSREQRPYVRVILYHQARGDWNRTIDQQFNCGSSRRFSIG